MSRTGTAYGSCTHQDPFELVITDVFNLTGRGAVVTGAIRSGQIRTGDTIQIWDAEEFVMDAVATVEFVCRRPPVPGEIGLRLGHVDINALRPGQTVRATRAVQS